MKTYIALLRGINVSGQKKIKMAELRSQLEGLGFSDVCTYIQSGNIIFRDSGSAASVLESRIAGMISRNYGFEVPVLVRDSDFFRQARERHPFAKDPENDPRQLHFTFLSGVPGPEQVDQLKGGTYQDEFFEVDETVIYLHTPKGYGRAKLNNNFLERKLKVSATTRNLKTVMALLAMTAS